MKLQARSRFPANRARVRLMSPMTRAIQVRPTIHMRCDMVQTSLNFGVVLMSVERKENPTASSNEPTSTSQSTSNPNTTMSETTNTPNNPTNAAQGGAPDPLKDTDKTGVMASQPGDARKAEDIVPSESSSNPGAAPASGAAPEFKQQGADKPKDAPTGEQEGAVKDTKDEAEDALKKRDPNDHSGEPMRIHDGSENKNSETQEENGSQEQDKDSKGTGDQWVKTSGLAADGGDFDATKPGAGREAERTWLHRLSNTLSRADALAGLMEEKGIKKTESNHGPPVESPERSGGKEKEKISMKDKIKDKLHIGKH